MSIRIAIVNTYGDENRGSAALNLAAIRIARRSFPAADIGLVTINEFDAPTRTRTYRHTLDAHPDVQILPPLLRPATLNGGAVTSLPLELLNGRVGWALEPETARFIEDAELVVSRGGVIYRGSASLARTSGLFRRTSALRFAQRKGIPTVMLGLHAGQIGGRLAERSCRTQYERAALVLPRGPLSAARVEALAPGAAVHRLPDSVFGAELRPTTTYAEYEGAIAVSVSDPLLPYADHFADILGGLVRGGLADRIVLVDQVTGDDSDRTACRRMLELLPGGTELVGDDLAPSQLIDLYGSCVGVVSSRLHAAVFGLVAGVPSFPIDLSRDHKAVDTFAEIGLDRCVLDPADPVGWSSTVVAGLADRQSAVDAVQRAAQRYRQSAPLLSAATASTSNAPAS